MNFQSLRRLQSKLSVAFVAAATLVLTSCGGGGASSSPNSSGALQLLPGASSLYAGVPYTFNIVGGRKPYLVTSSEPTLVELNFTTSANEFSFVARNPGVIDVGLDPNAVPSRSVNIEIRDSNGVSITNTYNVLQNFFTGYSQSYQNTCASSGTSGAPPACSGTDTVLHLIPVSNGGLFGNRELQLDKVRGDYSFVVEDPSVIPQLVNRIRVRTDHEGRAIVRLRVANNAPTQLATFKMTDVTTGVTLDIVFLIVNQAPVDTVTTVPTTISFTAGLATRCGSGTADVFVFGGVPPYTITASAGLAISPTTVAASGDRFQVTAPISIPPCATGLSVIVTDSRGSIAIVTVDTIVGTGTTSNMLFSPNFFDVLCGQSGQFTIVGGFGSYSVVSQHPRLIASISGNTGTVSRMTGDGAVIYPTNGSISFTDGNQVGTIGITTPANCP